jgi:hypothetical protein
VDGGRVHEKPKAALRALKRVLALLYDFQVGGRGVAPPRSVRNPTPGTIPVWLVEARIPEKI